MPNIPAEFTEAVVYLFPTVEAAASGQLLGGTGFLLGVPVRLADEARPPSHVYVVTNEHVTRGGSRVARLADGRIVDLQGEHWEESNTFDVAVCRLPVEEAPRHANVGDLLTMAEAERWTLGIGDDCFYIGRFPGLVEDADVNRPVARFGNIALFPPAPVHLVDPPYRRDAVLVESRSVSGTSGSPVFVYLSPFARRGGDGGIEFVPLVRAPCFLLGIVFGHSTGFEPVRDRSSLQPHPDGTVVVTNSGMMMVTPAWRILELINSTAFEDERNRYDAHVAELRRVGHDIANPELA